MKRKIYGLMAGLLMLTALPITVQAASLDGSSSQSWDVVFNGKEITSTYDADAVNSALKALQPGDTVKLETTINNASADVTDWYMSNEVTKSLESSKATGGSYSYRLTYTSGGTTTTLYDSQTIGGDDYGNGLKDATSSLDEFFYLGRLPENGTGTVSLEVGLEGETMANAYQLAQGSLQLNFAVDNAPANNGNPGNPDDPNGSDTSNNPPPSPGQTTTPPGNSVTTNNVKTGDDSHMLLFVGIALASGIGFMVLAVFSMRDKKKEKEGLV